jgi:hypothetical protein
MSYIVEKDWTTEAGFRATIIIHPAGHRCGYVGVPQQNPSYGKGYDSIDADVHGGLTFAGGDKTYPVENEGLWWLGYDCAHLGDARDPELMSGEYKKIYDKGLLREMSFQGDTVKTLEYCINECESLAKQLVEVTV